MAQTPEVLVPADKDMATEPARTIGQQFSDANFVKALVGALFTIVGVVAPHLVNSLDTNLANAISTCVVLLASVVVAQQARSVPKAQAAQTREVVWPAQSVADIQAEARASSGEKVEAVVIDHPAVSTLPGQ